MNLYLFRHTEAVPLDTPGIATDEDRPLSEKGILQAKYLGLAWQARKVAVPMVFSSPLLRARQTAEEFLRAQELPGEALLTREELLPGGRVRRVARFLNSLTEEEVMLVGHQPEMSKYCSWLIGQKRAQIMFSKGAVAMIQTEGMIQKGCGVLRWLITPEWVV